MAGLPGCGKTTLARQLAERLGAVILDKDAIRAALFPPPYIEYSTHQDDFCVTVMLEVAAYLFESRLDLSVILDGRPFAREYQIDQLDRWSAEHNVPLTIIECVCSDDVARGRLQHDVDTAAHAAQNRDYTLYQRIKESFDPIREPKLVVNTDQPLGESVDQALAYIRK
jgi:adenylylsulfate kinase